MRHLLSAILLAAALPAQAENRALVIGIDSYAQPLHGAVRDAARMAAVIPEVWNIPASQITTLTDDAATSDAILTALIDDLVGKTVAGDTALLYFAGKGTRLPGGDAAIVAHNADALLGQIPASVIADMLDLIPDRAVTVIIDAGFDGRADLIGGAQPRGIAGASAADQTPFGAGKVTRTIWNAAQPGQFAWEDLDRGVFTHALVTALTQKAGDTDGDGRITNAELHDHLARQTTLWCDTNATCAADGRGVIPAFTGPENATLLIGPAAAPQPVPVTAPILPPSDAPASYMETLGIVTDLFAPSNAAGLTLAMSTGPSPTIGQIIEFAATSERPGQLVLLDIDPDGNLVQVFPSMLAPAADTTLTPGQPLIIPNGRSVNDKPIRIRVTAPAGQGFLLGLLIEGDLPTLENVVPDSIVGGPVPNAGQYLYQMSQDLLARQAETTNPLRWSATYLPYTIHP